MKAALVPGLAGLVVGGVVTYLGVRGRSAPSAELVVASAPVSEPVAPPRPTLDGEPADVAEAVTALRKMQQRLKAVERSTAELVPMRKRLGDVSKTNASVAELSESLPRIEKRMREVAEATSLLPELLHAVEKMTKSIDRMADRMPPPAKR